ncbi:MAG: glycosyltransferase [bacterium]
MKIALVSHILPPSWSGQAMILAKILQGIRPEDYCLLSYQRYDDEDASTDYTHRLPVKYHLLTMGWQLTRGYRWGIWKIRQVINALLAPLATRQRARQIAQIVRQEKCDAIIACTGDMIDLPAAYLASKITGAKFYPYYFDDYRLHWTMWLAKLYANREEPNCIKNADGIIVPNEFMRNALYERYGVTATVIHNSCDLSLYGKLPGGIPQKTSAEVRIVYTGTVYEAHYDAFRNLMAAINQLKQLNIRLHLFTITQKHELAAAGITGPIELHSHAVQTEIPEIQQQADVLFLPLAFNSPYPELVKTSEPGKMGEYLAAGRPVLVHAPADAYICWYFRTHACGIVVDRNDPAVLAQALAALIADRKLQDDLVAQALACAEADFSVTVAQRNFAELLQVRLIANAGHTGRE